MMTWDMKFRDDRGMTMTELAISLAIMAALSLFLGSELQAMANRVFLDAAASEVIGDLQYARSLAVWERQAIQVIVNVEQPGITLYRAGDLSHPLRPVPPGFTITTDACRYYLEGSTEELKDQRYGNHVDACRSGRHGTCHDGQSYGHCALSVTR